jgi:hypothetical protein
MTFVKVVAARKSKTIYAKEIDSLQSRLSFFFHRQGETSWEV